MDILGDLASDKVLPFTNDDLFVGQRMCNMRQSLSCKVVDYDTNEWGALPKSTEVAQKLLSIRGDDHANINSIVSISLTMLTDLWPGYKYPPPTPQVLVLYTVQLMPKMLGSPTNLKETHEAPETHQSLARAASITQEMIFNPSLQPVVQVMPGQGERKSAMKYTTHQVDILLDCTEEILPCGKIMWDNVSLACNGIDPDFLRNGESCKYKFHKMVFTKKPTGQAEMTIQIRCKNSIKRKIDAEEVIRMVGGNKADMDEHKVSGNSDVSSTRWSLVVANLSQGNSDEVWRPLTKKQGGFYMVEEIEHLTEVNR